MISKILSGHHNSGSWVTESPFFYFCPRPLGVRSLLDRSEGVMVFVVSADCMMVISIGGSISSMHTLASPLGLWNIPRSKTLINHTEINLSYLYILSIIPNSFQLCVAAGYKPGWEGQVRMGRGELTQGLTRSTARDDNCWLMLLAHGTWSASPCQDC